MKKHLLLFIILLFPSFLVSAQNFKGQWKGTFLDKSTSFVGWGGDRCDYVLELDVDGKDVSGYSYTYFTDGGKKYYTICSLKGYVNKSERYIEIKEVVRTKTNVPNNIRNCFQVHKLSYSKSDEAEMLEGSWVPAPNQEGDCGYGTTTLERRVLKKNYSLYNKQPLAAKKVAPNDKKQLLQPDKNKARFPVVKQSPKKVNEEVLRPKKEIVQPVEIPVVKNKMDDRITAPAINFEKRNNAVLKTIEVENTSVKVDLYDNGEVDGDSVSLFYNGKLLLSHKRLSEKPISLSINVDKDKSLNELVMYADNLGTIPPNTALMVVMDGTKRYEIRITSDLQKSGAIRFALKPDVAGK